MIDELFKRLGLKKRVMQKGGSQSLYKKKKTAKTQEEDDVLKDFENS